MGREISFSLDVAYGFQTGHHYFGEQVLKSYAICYRSTQVVIYVYYGLRKIMALQQLKLAYFKHLNMMNFVHSGLRRAYLRFCD